MQSKLVKWLIVIGVGFGIAVITPPDGVPREAWTLLAIFVATVVGSIVQPMSGSAMVLLGVIATAVFGALKIERSLSGYADKYVWLVLAAFFISRAMIKTGLGHRIALILIRLIGRKTIGLGYSLVVTDFILASFVPSTGARSGGIILPIARSVSETYDSRPDDGTAGKLGTFLMNMLYQCEVILCATFLTGQASNLMIRSFAKEHAQIDLSYSLWFISSIVPAMVSLTVIPLMIYKFFPPEIKETPDAVVFAQNKLEKLGPLSRPEKILLAVFVLVVSLWISTPWHGIDATVIALFGIAFLLITQVLDWSDVINETHAWEVFIWYGGLVMMATALGETNLTKLFAESVAGVMTGWSWPLALIVLALVYFYAHYGFASITAHVTAMFIPFLAVTIAVGAPAGLTVLVLTYFSNLSAGLTHYGTTPAPVYFGTGYVKQGQWWTIGLIASILNILIWSTVGLGWWKVLGRW
ncbi:MAG: DASS family sodium-coupled anion symporter [Pyrinomonadaceae bacterium]|nr:DASS family sodium-coupled anion symporter [Pyrinomonadaceae bacterium]MBP6211655.1 DASS family sodium-coupled anion symporter [Pyrinomonadaceae bacterium]